MTFYGTVSLDFFILKSWCLCAFVANLFLFHEFQPTLFSTPLRDIYLSSYNTSISHTGLKWFDQRGCFEKQGDTHGTLKNVGCQGVCHSCGANAAKGDD